MKTITIELYKNGSTYVKNKVFSFDQENKSVMIEITPPSDHEEYGFRTDIITPTKETTFKTGLSFLLDSSILKKGIVELQVVATKDDKVKKWHAFSIDIKRSLNVIEDDTTVTVSVASELYDLVNTKADEVHTHDISDLRGFNGATWLNLDTLLRAIKE